MAGAHKPGIGAIFGIVSENGVIKVGSPVNLYDRTNGKLVRRQLTTPDGGFVFNGLDDQQNIYQIVATDEDGEPPKNALVQDYIQPIPAYSGAYFWGNWQTQVMQENPVAVFAGPMGTIDQNAIITGGTVPIRQTGLNREHTAPVAPYAPHLPMASLTELGFVTTGRMFPECDPGNFNYDAPLKVVIECVFDPTTAAHSNDIWFGAWIEYDYRGQDHSFYAYQQVMISFRFNPVDKSITLVNNGDPSGATDEYDSSTYGLFKDILTYDLSSASGPVHLFANVIFAAEANLWVDGSLVVTETNSLSGTNAHINGSGASLGGFFVSGATQGQELEYGSSGTEVDYIDIGAMAWYIDWTPTDEDAKAHYNALFSEQTPVVTGYQKEIMMDWPLYHYRLHEIDMTVGQPDSVTWGGENTSFALPYNPSGMTPTANNFPVVGGSGIRFDGQSGFYAPRVPAGFGNRYEFTFVFLAQFTSPEGQSSSGTICESQDIVDNYNIIIMYQLQRNYDSGSFTLHVNESGTLIKYDFSTPIPDTWEWYAIRMHKIDQTLELISTDGSGDMLVLETLTTSGVALRLADDHDQHQDRRFVIGAEVNPDRASQRNSTGYIGSLSELSLFPKYVNDGRLQAIIDSMSIV